jgi:hypothetical protein
MRAGIGVLEQWGLVLESWNNGGWYWSPGTMRAGIGVLEQWGLVLES